MSNTNNFKIVQYNIRKESSLLTSLLQDEIIKDVDVLAIPAGFLYCQHVNVFDDFILKQ